MVMPGAETSGRIRAEPHRKILNSGSPQRFQAQPSLRDGALRWMQAKPLEMCRQGLTHQKRCGFLGLMLQRTATRESIQHADPGGASIRSLLVLVLITQPTGAGRTGV
ncbi:hypothetical protein [Stenotrophomonas sp.]|uniref:hypothetical protein n=1 Tax=Stenotrophomonas sp. TaxID=69392 RepID=UPI002FC8732F